MLKLIISYTPTHINKVIKSFFHKGEAKKNVENKLLDELHAYKLTNQDINRENVYVKTALTKNNNSVDFDSMYRYMTFAEKKGVAFISFLYSGLEKYVDDDSAFAEALEKKINKDKARKKKQYDSIEGVTSLSQETMFDALKTLNIAWETFINNQYHLLSSEQLMEIVDLHKQKMETYINDSVLKSGMNKSDFLAHMRYCYEKFGIEYEDYSSFNCYEVNDETLSEYFTNGLSKCMRAYYNTSKGNSILMNKDRFERYYRKFLGRDSIKTDEMSFDDFKSFVYGKNQVIVKPLTSKWGKGIYVINLPIENEFRLLYEELKSGPPMMIEEIIQQHHKMNEMYSGSVNTVRLVTIQMGVDVHIVTGFVRFGVTGSVDNYEAGGIVCRMDLETGIIITDGVSKELGCCTHHPVSGIKFKGFQIPLWNKVKEMAEAAIREYAYVNYAGWDLAICEDKVVVVEGNSWPGIDSSRQKDKENFPGRRALFKGLTPF